MATWMKRTFNAEGVTEYPAGLNLRHLTEKFGGSGAVVLCIDVSGSMAGAELREAQKGGQGFISDAGAGGYRVGLVLWDHEVVASVAPTDDLARVRAELDRGRARGGTRLAPALELAQSMLLTTDVTDRVCVAFTDGALSDQSEAEGRAAQMKSGGIRILTIGLGGAAARGLAAIASGDQPMTTASTADTLATDMQRIAGGLSVKRRR